MIGALTNGRVLERPRRAAKRYVGFVDPGAAVRIASRSVSPIKRRALVLMSYSKDCAIVVAPLGEYITDQVGLVLEVHIQRSVDSTLLM